jgi:magnesium-dependent phosphatase 1
MICDVPYPVAMPSHNTTVLSTRSYALTEINRLKKQGHDIRAAAASRSDVPSWARICLDHLVIDDGTILKDCFAENVELYGGVKVDHIRQLHEKTGIAYSDMAFFDDEKKKNIIAIQEELHEVKTFYVPEGMTRQAWDEAKAAFGM